MPLPQLLSTDMIEKPRKLAFKSSWLSQESFYIRISSRRGLNALCAELNEKNGEVLFSWGISFEEFHSRSVASTTKVHLLTSAIDTVRAHMSEHQYVQQMDLFGRWIYSKGSLGTPEVLSFPYSWGDLGYEKCYTLLWLAQKLVSHHQTGSSSQLCIIGPTGSQKTLLVQMLSSFFHLYYALATLDNLGGAEYGW